MVEKCHPMKMCELRAKGLLEEFDRNTTAPTAVCGKCGLKANRRESLHNPRPLAGKKGDSFW